MRPCLGDADRDECTEGRSLLSVLIPSRPEGLMGEMREPATSGEDERSLIEAAYHGWVRRARDPQNEADTAVEHSHTALARTRWAKNAQFVIKQRTGSNRTRAGQAITFVP